MKKLIGFILLLCLVINNTTGQQQSNSIYYDTKTLKQVKIETCQKTIDSISIKLKLIEDKLKENNRK